MPGFQPTVGAMAPPPFLPPGSARMKLPCVVSLKAHFDNGGLDQNGFDMLSRMIELISAIGWEVHLIWSSKMATARSIERVESSMDFILQGCNVFYKNMEDASSKAKDAASRLPALGDKADESQKTKLKQWKWTLKILHDPVGNDRRLFKWILDHYGDVIERLMTLHQRKPGYGLQKIANRAIEVRNAFDALIRLAGEADRRAKHLQKEYRTASAMLAAHQAKAESQNQRKAAFEHLTAAEYQPSMTQARTALPPIFSKSFGVAEEEAARKRQGRSGKSREAASDDSVLAESRSRTQGPTTITRRREASTPRVFTGSFSDLESNVQKLRLHKVETPETTAPKDSPHNSPNSPPLLQRREALVNKETELQDRLIKGEVVSSRRPSTKERSEVTSNTTDLDAWTKHEASKLPDFPDFDDKTGAQKPRTQR